mgnify:CR=1 FL=1
MNRNIDDFKKRVEKTQKNSAKLFAEDVKKIKSQIIKSSKEIIEKPGKQDRVNTKREDLER